MNKAVDQYLLKLKNWQAELKVLREILLAHDIDEEVKCSDPVYSENANNVAAICLNDKYR